MRAALLPIVAQWVETGQLAEADKPVLKAAYLEAVGATPGCTTCDSFWSEVRQHFFYAYKQLNRTNVAQSIRKYLILGTGFLMLPGSSQIIVNEGQNSDDRVVLTDENAELILAKYPDYKTLIGINPVWQALEDAKAEQADDDQEEEDFEDHQTADTVPAETHADLQSKFDALQTEHTALQAENKQLKTTNSTLKGQLTRLQNAQSSAPHIDLNADKAATSASNASATVATPGDTSQSEPVPSTATPADTSTSKTDVATSGQTTPASNGANGESSAGNSGANSVKTAVDDAKA